MGRSDLTAALRRLAARAHVTSVRRLGAAALLACAIAGVLFWRLLPERLFFNDSSHPLLQALIEATEAAGGEVIETGADILHKISGKDNPQAVLGVYRQFETGLDRIDRAKHDGIGPFCRPERNQHDRKLPNCRIEPKFKRQPTDDRVGAAQPLQPLSTQQRTKRTHFTDWSRGPDPHGNAIHALQTINQARRFVIRRGKVIERERGAISPRIALHADRTNGQYPAVASSLRPSTARRTKTADRQARPWERVPLQ